MKKETILIISIVIILTLVLTAVSLYFKFDFGITKIVTSVHNAPESCRSIGGTVEGESSIFGMIKCYGIDSNGYKFYYHLDEQGNIYKTKA